MAKEENRASEAAERIQMLKIMADTAAKLSKEPKKTIMLPLHDEKEADVFVSLNGSRYQIKRGEEVEVPESIYNILIESQKQDQIALKRSRDLAKRFEDKIRNA